MSERFRDALQRCLDDGADPLADPTVRAHLDAHPEDLDAFAALTASLRALRGVAAATATTPLPEAAVAAPRWRRRVAAAAAAVLLLATATFVTLTSRPTAGMPPPPHIDPRGRFLAGSYSLPTRQRPAPPRVHVHVVSDRIWRMPPADDAHRTGTFAVAVLRLQNLED